MIAIRVESSCFHTSQTPYAYLLTGCLLTCKTDLNMTYSLSQTTFLFPAVGNNLNALITLYLSGTPSIHHIQADTFITHTNVTN